VKALRFSVTEGTVVFLDAFGLLENAGNAPLVTLLTSGLLSRCSKHCECFGNWDWDWYQFQEHPSNCAVMDEEIACTKHACTKSGELCRALMR
jgi:hypothetical protein